jgi:hypothetical protein
MLRKVNEVWITEETKAVKEPKNGAGKCTRK